jgi:hypothetical protein
MYRFPINIFLFFLIQVPLTGALKDIPIRDISHVRSPLYKKTRTWLEKKYYDSYSIITSKEDDVVVAYRLVEPLIYRYEDEEMKIWGGTLLANQQETTQYIMLMAPRRLPTSIKNIMINDLFEYQEMMMENPVLVSENNKNEGIFVYILQEVGDVIIVKGEKSVGENTCLNGNKLTYRISYKIKSIQICLKTYLMELFKCLSKYSVGLQIQNKDLELLSKLSVTVALSPHLMEHHLIFYTPHDFGDCQKPVDLSDRKVIYMIITLNKNNNVIQDIVIKTSCCISK